MSLFQFFRDIRSFKKATLIAIILFIIGILLGTINSEVIDNMIQPSIAQLQSISSGLSTSGNPEWSFFKFIFINNVTKSLAVMALGCFAGLVPAFFLVMNGMMMGYIVAIAAASGQDWVHMIVRGILPHGIIELPVIIIAAAYGLQFGYLVLRGIGEMGGASRENRTVNWREYFQKAIRGAVWIVLLLGLAAIIESTLTFHLVK